MAIETDICDPCSAFSAGRRPYARRGYTLLEVLIASSILSLLFAIAINLYVGALRAAGSNNALASAMSRGSAALQQTMRQYRECYSAALPTDTGGFVPPQTGTQAANYVTSDGSAAALQLVMPSTAAVTVVNSVGASKTSGMDFSMTYARSAGVTVTYYRSDAAGNPAPNTGQYLWQCGTVPGQVTVPATGRRIAQLAQTAAIAANTPHAVVFAHAPGTISAIEFTVVAGDYSLINGQQNSQGNAAQAVGWWVNSRNHS